MTTKSNAAILEQMRRAKNEGAQTRVDRMMANADAMDGARRSPRGDHFGPDWSFAAFGDPYRANVLGHDEMARFYDHRKR